MKRLSQSEENEIRSYLDEIEARMYHGIVLFDDIYWSHRINKRLLYLIHELQIGKKEREGDDLRG
jgi:hypothetical protein